MVQLGRADLLARHARQELTPKAIIEEAVT
jgi:hypothetical protein